MTWISSPFICFYRPVAYLGGHQGGKYPQVPPCRGISMTHINAATSDCSLLVSDREGTACCTVKPLGCCGYKVAVAWDSSKHQRNQALLIVPQSQAALRYYKWCFPFWYKQESRTTARFAAVWHSSDNQRGRALLQGLPALSDCCRRGVPLSESVCSEAITAPGRVNPQDHQSTTITDLSCLWSG